ncbi:hypothetical protein [Alteribacillus sp. HJP-4]|uniref:hypothetical protein n=1 Tax=Alteribacillus sp. HJP-4 TaxID=2775394 RepID=UPI0035CD1E93
MQAEKGKTLAGGGNRISAVEKAMAARKQDEFEGNHLLIRGKTITSGGNDVSEAGKEDA